jgi:hypothetical protein
MKRVLIRSITLSVATGLVVYALARISLTLSHRGRLDELPLFIGFMAIAVGTLFPLSLIVGLSTVPAEQRIVRQFGLSSCLQRQPGYQRVVKLLVSPKSFLNEMRVLIARSMTTFPFTDDIQNGRSLTCQVRNRLGSRFEVRIDVHSDDLAYVTVHRIAFLASIAPSELGAAKILAGLIKWAAARGLVRRDFTVTNPEQLSKDLGNWLPSVNAWAPVGPECEAVLASLPTLRAKLDVPAGRIVAATGIALGVFMGLDCLRRFGFGVPSIVQVVPLYGLLAYLVVLIVRVKGRSAHPEAPRSAAKDQIHRAPRL